MLRYFLSLMLTFLDLSGGFSFCPTITRDIFSRSSILFFLLYSASSKTGFMSVTRVFQNNNTNNINLILLLCWSIHTIKNSLQHLQINPYFKIPYERYKKEKEK